MSSLACDMLVASNMSMYGFLNFCMLPCAHPEQDSAAGTQCLQQGGVAELLWLSADKGMLCLDVHMQDIVGKQACQTMELVRKSMFTQRCCCMMNPGCSTMLLLQVAACTSSSSTK